MMILNFFLIFAGLISGETCIKIEIIDRGNEEFEELFLK